MRLGGLVAACLCSLATFAVQPALGATPPTTYADPSRDASSGAPELTTVVVTNDDAGRIRFRINVANQARLAADATVELFLDTDRDAATGDPLALGADYRFVVDGRSRTFDFARWDGARFDSAAPSETASVWYWSGVSITIDRTELGGATALGFWVRTSAAGRTADTAPDAGTWPYDLVAGGVNPADIDSFSYRVRPAAPRAGSTWQLQVDSLRLVGGGSARADSSSCKATVAGRALRPAAARSASRARPAARSSR